MAPPSLHDVWFLIRAILTRPGDVPGILRRGKARSAAGKVPDPDGLGFLMQSWAAALAADAFLAPAGDGAPVSPDPEDIAGSISALQTARAVYWGSAAPSPRLGALSLEAARLSLPQSATNPASLRAARRAYLDAATLPGDLRAVLEALSENAG